MTHQQIEFYIYYDVYRKWSFSENLCDVTFGYISFFAAEQFLLLFFLKSTDHLDHTQITLP